MFFLCSAALIRFICFNNVGRWILLSVLVFWAVVQFFCHWYYTIFEVSENKLHGYNQCFQNTLHIIKMSDTRLIPDLYHIILHLLIMNGIVLLIL